MSLVYLKESENKDKTLEIKNKLIEIGHSVIVTDKLDVNILCRCDYLVMDDTGVDYPIWDIYYLNNISEWNYATSQNIPSYRYSILPELPEKEKTMSIFTRMILEGSMNEYREKINKFNNGSLEIGVCNEKIDESVVV